MKILVADDHETNRRLLRALLVSAGHTVLEARDGDEALRLLATWDGPCLALLDWQMPGHTGLEVCRALRAAPGGNRAFVIVLTVRDSPADIVAGLAAGANDYIAKPYNADELMARIAIGLRTLELQEALARRVEELERALADVRQLSRLLPMCTYCRKVRDDRNYWQQVELYLAEHTATQVSHGICPDCFDRTLKPQLVRLGVPPEEISALNYPHGQRP
jgi:DNA-binding response OmpR family regulator